MKRDRDGSTRDGLFGRVYEVFNERPRVVDVGDGRYAVITFGELGRCLASCTSPESAEAARRLMSGECKDAL